MSWLDFDSTSDLKSAFDEFKRTSAVEPVGLLESSSDLIGRSPMNVRVMPVVIRLQAMLASNLNFNGAG